MNSAAIDIEGLTVVRGAVTALDDVTLRLPAGQVTGLLGPSGCGKSTLMRAIVGVQRIRSGSVTVLGLPAGAAALRARVGYMTQAASVYADLSARENLRFLARVTGAVPARIDAVLDLVALGPHADRPVQSLSGGQRTRVSLAAALLGDPEVVVLDEPTVGLDPVLRRDLWRTFAQLAQAGKTLVVSSHVMDEAEHCDELVLLRDGHVLAVEPPRSLVGRTGADDVEGAFLALVEAGAAA